MNPRLLLSIDNLARLQVAIDARIEQSVLVEREACALAFEQGRMELDQ